MQRKIIFLINPRSGTGRKTSLREVLARESEGRGVDYEVLETNEAGDYAYLRQRIPEQQVTDIVVCGGDGSVNAVAGQLIGIEVNIGIIPMGSGNGLAFTAGIPKGIMKALEIIFIGRAAYIDGFFINGEFSCMLCGIGFDAKVAHEFAEEKRRGLQTYIKRALINYFSAKAYPFKITHGRETISTEAFFISIANSNQFGNNVTIAPHASLSDGLLDVVVVKRMSKLILPFSLLRHITGINGRQQLGQSQDKNKILYFQTDGLTIINSAMAPLHIDGEPKETAGRFEIKVVRKAMKLLQPRQFNV